MRLEKRQLSQIERIARRARLKFVRIFGSTLASASHRSKSARDIDLVVGPGPLTVSQLLTMVDAFELVFGKRVDVILLGAGLSPLLIHEIASRSRPLWEDPAGGRERYVELMDRFWAIAEDERLSFPERFKSQSVKRIQRKLRVT